MSIAVHLKHSEEGEAGNASRPYRQENAPWDGYSLYRLLSDGEPHSIEVNGSTYRFQLRGHRAGSNNWLEVTPSNGTSQKWGWGWSSEVCWHCLQDLGRGWNTPRLHQYRPYRADSNEE